MLEEALQLAERSGNMRALGTALNNIAFSYLLGGDLEANLTYRRRSLDLAERGSEAIGLIFGHAMVAQALTVMGRLAEANGMARNPLAGHKRWIHFGIPPMLLSSWRVSE